MTPDGSFADQPLPSFLSADKSKQQDVGTIWEAADMSSRALKTSILTATAALIGLVALEVGSHPAIHFPKFTAPSTDAPTARQEPAPPPPTMQATTEAELPSLIVTGLPGRNDMAPRAASPSRSEETTPSPNVLLMQFQAWAARQAARPEPDLGAPDQDAPAPIMTDDAPMGIAPPLPRKARPSQFMQPEIPHIPLPRARLQWGQNARVEGRPVQAPRLPDQAVQNGPPQTILQSFGWRQ
jgi:hypothetical protein